MQKILCYVKQNKLELSTVVLITLLALILRIISLINCGEMWYDELFSWSFAAKDSLYNTIIDSVKDDIHMPLYFALLHFWLKIVGKYNVEGMHVLSLILFIPLIPLSYYLTKDLFNRSTAYFTTIYITINTFCIYYSNEVRFYSMVLVLSFLVAYFFTKTVENFNKKNIIFFIISSSLLFYTFSITPLLIFVYFIVGLTYLLIKKRENVKKFLLVNLILFIIAFPAIFFTILNAYEMKHALTYFPIDNFPFDIRMINDFLENFFTTRNAQLYNSDFRLYTYMFENIKEFPYFMFVFLPILIGLFGFFKSLFSKNEKLYLFLVPSIIFLMVIFVLSGVHVAVLQTRYLNIIFPVVICATCYGFSSIKNEIISLSFYMLFVFLNLMNIAYSNTNIFNMHRFGLDEFNTIYKYNIKVRDNDYILAPMLTDRIRFYAKKGIVIPFSVEGAFVLKDDKSKKFYLGGDYKKYTRDNIRQYLFEYVIEDKPFEEFEKNLYEQYIKNLKSGQRIILVSFFGIHIYPPEQVGISYDNYYDFNLPVILLSKSTRDCYLILNKYLKEKEKYDTIYSTVVVFEKE